jgi:hypothetical protein
VVQAFGEDCNAAVDETEMHQKESMLDLSNRAAGAEAHSRPWLTRLVGYSLGFLTSRRGVAKTALRDPAATSLALTCFSLIIAIQLVSYLIRGGSWQPVIVMAAQALFYWFVQGVILHRLTLIVLKNEKRGTLYVHLDVEDLLPYLQIAGFASVTYLLFLLGFLHVPREILRIAAKAWMVVAFWFGLRDGLDYTSKKTWLVAAVALLALEGFQSVIRFLLQVL